MLQTLAQSVATLHPHSPPLVALDANALDRDGTDRDRQVAAFEALVQQGRVCVFLPSGVIAELSHPHAPNEVRAMIPVGIMPKAMRLTAAQQIDRIRVRAILRGNGQPGKHDADAAHLSEAAEAGCRFFITNDGKVLRRRDILRMALPPSLRIATLADALDWIGRSVLPA